jgi:hypothetical protein
LHPPSQGSTYPPPCPPVLAASSCIFVVVVILYVETEKQHIIRSKMNRQI